jgi:ketosteroid isomerase-like protein
MILDIRLARLADMKNPPEKLDGSTPPVVMFVCEGDNKLFFVLDDIQVRIRTDGAKIETETTEVRIIRL